MVDLDSLLDTRLAVIRNINPEAASFLMESDEYWLREHDDWEKLTEGRITNAAFKAAWAMRGGENTADTLNASVETGLSPFILRLLAEANINARDNMAEVENEIGIAVNIAPYVLSNDQREELEEIIHAKYGKELPVRIYDIKLEDLTCVRLDAVCDMLITYQFIDWMHLHHEELAKVTMSDFNMIGPKMFEKDPSELTVAQKQREFFMFRLTKLLNMDIEWIDSMYFSMFRGIGS